MSYANSNEKGTPEALCPICTPIPFNITRLRYVRTILTPEPVMIFYCPKCRKEYHEYQVIHSNYTWLYIEEEKESEKKMTEWISLVDGKCPFNPNHSLKQYDEALFYCNRCDLIFQEKKRV